MEDLSQDYQTLGVKKEASGEEMTDAYNDLVKIWHSDQFVDDPEFQIKAEEKLKEITSAYNRLKEHLKKDRACSYGSGEVPVFTEETTKSGVQQPPPSPNLLHETTSNINPSDQINDCPHVLWKQIIGVAIPIVSLYLLLYFVMFVVLKYNVLEYNFTDDILLILLGILIFTDAWLAGIYKKSAIKSFLNISPMGWCIGTIVIYFVFFPIYVANRNRLKTKKGYTIVFVFIILVGCILLRSSLLYLKPFIIDLFK